MDKTTRWSIWEWWNKSVLVARRSRGEAGAFAVIVEPSRDAG